MNMNTTTNNQEDRFTLDISKQDQEIVLQALPKNLFIDKNSRWSAFINKLCLQKLTEFIIEELPYENNFISVWRGEDNLPQIWELVNGFAINLNDTKIVVIPLEVDEVSNSHFIIPQEWIDIPSWRGDYYLFIQVCLRENDDDDDDYGYVNICGYSIYDTIKENTYFSKLKRCYYLDSEDIIDDFVTFLMIRRFKPKTLDEAELSHDDQLLKEKIKLITNKEQLIKELSNPTLYSPRYLVEIDNGVSEDEWFAILDNPELLKNLYSERLAGSQLRQNHMQQILEQSRNSSVLKVNQLYKILSDNLRPEMENIFSCFELDYIIEDAIELVETGDKDREILINEVKELLYEIADVSGSEEEQIFPLEYVRERREKLDELAVKLMDEIVVYVEKQSQSTESSETTPKPVYINIPSLFSLVKNETVSVTNEIVSGISEIGNEIVSGFSEIKDDLFPEYSYKLESIPVRSEDRSSDASSDDIKEIAKIIELDQESLLLVITVKEDKENDEYDFKFFLCSRKEKYLPQNIEIRLLDDEEKEVAMEKANTPNYKQLEISKINQNPISAPKGDKFKIQICRENMIVTEELFET